MIDTAFGRRLADFRLVCAAHPYVAKGIFYSELFLFLETCARRGVQRVIESGVKHGFSTRMLHAAFPGPLISVDQVACVTPPGVHFVKGNALAVVPLIAERMSDRRLGILIDGPKGDAALALKDACALIPSVHVVAVHDAQRGGGETFHSQDPAFRKFAGCELDALITHAYAAKYPVGPGLAVWVRA